MGALVWNPIRSIFRPMEPVVTHSVHIGLPLILFELSHDWVTFRHKYCTFPLVPEEEIVCEERYVLFRIAVYQRRPSRQWT